MSIELPLNFSAPRMVAYAIIALVSLLLLTDTVFQVDQREQVIIFQFGDAKRVIQEPGLYAKLPIIQDLQSFDRRILNLDPPAEQVILADQERLDVNAYARYRINDPLKFRQAVSNEFEANQRLGNIINSSIRQVLGSITLTQLLSDVRTEIMEQIRVEVREASMQLGVDVIDVRIRQADLPAATIEKVFERMRSEREREAKEFRGQGYEQAQQIIARANRERTVLLAEANRKAEELRGQGDAEAIRIQAEAFGRDARFYQFYRTMMAYRQTLTGDSTTYVLSPDSDFLRLFKDVPSAN